MKLTNKPILNALVIATIGAGFAAPTATLADDGRESIVLEPDQRDLILMEMRTFLESIQAITAAVAEEDMETIAAVASAVGMANAGTTPPEIVAKLPLGFKQLAVATHTGFDVIANEAQDMADPQAIIVEMGELMNNCIACHASYRLDLVGWEN